VGARADQASPLPADGAVPAAWALRPAAMRPEPDRPLLALVAGFTGGHVCPALAVAEAWQARGGRVLFIGNPARLEAELVRARGWPLAYLDAHPYFGVGRLGRLVAALSLARSTWRCRTLLARHRPVRVIGMGGHVAAGALLAARSLRIPTAQHEANAWPGLTNRLLAPLTDWSFLGFADAAPRLRAARMRVVGTPVRRAIVDLGAAPPRPAPGPVCRLLVVGGSLGSAFLDQQAPALVAALKAQGRPVNVLHRAVAGAEAATRARYGRFGIEARVTAAIDDMASVYADTDFVVTSAGASTLAELAIVGLPALLVPLASASEDHQRANAEAFAAETGADWCTEAAWSAADLARRVAALINDPPRWRARTAALRAAARPDSAERMVDDLVADLGAGTALCPVAAATAETAVQGAGHTACGA
jgi:UDP-N-acetylglucosamine--N-acetylmuramyl-(pentapeptide) pyrophosphoryl-undecaprenol N-acetylglucosamine transferase